jgi:nucleoside-diphosphate-sugar epimerase
VADQVLVTGGSGFVASWCIAALLRRGYRVRTTLRSPAKQAAVRSAVGATGALAEALTFATADLVSDTGWDAATWGCTYVLHVASPLGGARDLVAPARDGTLRVLRAAVGAGAKRVVMTSAAAAARLPRNATGVADEAVWSDPADPRFDAYRRSKILAERAAWDFMAGKPTELTTILPGAVLGPALIDGGAGGNNRQQGSLQVIQRMLDGKLPGVPRLAFWIIDVRDLAELHVRAMTDPRAAGERFLGTGELMWMIDIATTLRTKLGERGARVPTRELPSFLVRALSLVSPQLRALAPELGRRNDVTSEKARRLLDLAPRPAVETVVDTANYLLTG